MLFVNYKENDEGSRVAELKPRTYTVRKFKPGETGSKWASHGVFDGDELLGLADLKADGSDGALVPGTAQAALSEAIRRRAEEKGESLELAEWDLVHTEEGMRLWEEARQERLEHGGQTWPRRANP